VRDAAESKRPRAARIAWLLGGAALLAAAVCSWITLGPPTMNDRALERATEAASGQAHDAVGRLVTAAREGDLTDARINHAFALSTAGVRGIRRLGSAIVVTAEIRSGTRAASGSTRSPHANTTESSQEPRCVIWVMAGTGVPAHTIEHVSWICEHVQ
jgi:hypothetical protein